MGIGEIHVGHRCRWPGCKERILPHLWMCSMHWRRLPKGYRHAIWNTYRGVTVTVKAPSHAYRDAVAAALAWAREQPPEARA